MNIDELLDDYYYVRKWYEEACEENNKEEKDKYWKELDLIIKKLKAEKENNNI